MVNLIDSGKAGRELQYEFEALSSMIDDATTFDELLWIEEQVGVSALLGYDTDWDQAYEILHSLQSPFATIMKQLYSKLEYIDKR
jgi:hypothetical protein